MPAPSPLRDAYRLVVRANKTSRHKEFIWQIVRGQSREVIAFSNQTFSTMEDAHTHGSIALRRYQIKRDHRRHQ